MKALPLLDRRQFLKLAGMATAGSFASINAQDIVKLPFENGERKLVKYPQKRPLIVLTSRPPQLETPFEVFNEGVITPNDAFFVRYHLANIPLKVDTEAFRLEVKGLVEKPISYSLEELKTKFEPAEIVAVNQCSGNSRGFFKPRVGGGQLGHGAMGNAKWKGVRLKDLLEKAGVKAGAAQVVCNGLDQAVLPATPDFVKALEMDHALNEEVILAYEMNGEPLPMLNGFPLRLVVPGYYGTYWIKHLHELIVVDEKFDGFYMSAAYRIANNASGCIEPGTTASSTIPIHRFKIRSFLTSLKDGDEVKAGQTTLLRGFAFDGGEGITEVQVSSDGGKTWQGSMLGKNLGKYSFREWTLAWSPARAGKYELLCRAINRIGESQPMEPLWNPQGYMRNVVERTTVTAL